MTKKCPICGKGTIKGGHYSSKVRATKFNPTGTRKRRPNLQWAGLASGGRIKICTSCLKKNLHLKGKGARVV
ncbi:MAG: 50S ribosomal protein L28 [Candidatus Parcubacteria bacterium]|nr:50S ribosomal protein L28 [Candidatus Parcubacteria bacterium]